jgi:hypothetical protein
MQYHNDKVEIKNVVGECFLRTLDITKFVSIFKSNSEFTFRNTFNYIE